MTSTTPTLDLTEIVDNPALSDEDVLDLLTSFIAQAMDAVASISAPLDHTQRQAMFAAFTNVFGSNAKEGRKVFTRLALGKPADAPVSWADQGDRNGQGALTRREGDRVLAALKALEAAV